MNNMPSVLKDTRHFYLHCKGYCFAVVLPTAVYGRIASATNTEDASNIGFSVSFGLSSSKGTKPYFVLRTKISSKILVFEVLGSFQIINLGYNEAKTQGIW